MKGTICSSQKCYKCGSVLKYDENQRRCYCRKHPEVEATKGFFVRFGSDHTKRFNKDLDAAIRHLTGLRFKVDEGTYDPRDYRADLPLSFHNLVEKWLLMKAKTKIRPKTLRELKNIMGKAIAVWGNRNIKAITNGEIEDFIFDDHRTAKGDPISDKTRANWKSCLHDFWSWASRREKHIQMPQFPQIKFVLGSRNITDLETQGAVLNELKRISWNYNPKIWLGIWLLANYPRVRPGELRTIRERDIDLKAGYLVIPDPKERKPKHVKLIKRDIDLIRQIRDMEPIGMPDMMFFRHGAKPPKGTKPHTPFGSDYFWKWWRRACENIGLEGVSLYPGTKHTTATGLGALYSPEDVQDHATGHASDAFRRYFRPHESKVEVITLDIDRLRQGDPSVIHYSDHKKKKTH
jgi:integrase